MRTPHGKIAALRQAEASATDLHDAGYTGTRKPTPPDAWDDILVSYTRGQAWARKLRTE